MESGIGKAARKGEHKQQESQVQKEEVLAQLTEGRSQGFRPSICCDRSILLLRGDPYKVQTALSRLLIMRGRQKRFKCLSVNSLLPGQKCLLQHVVRAIQILAKTAYQTGERQKLAVDAFSSERIFFYDII